MIWNGCQKIRSKKPDTERDCPASFTRCARRRTLQMDINFWENVLFLTAIFPDHFQKIPRMLRQIPVFPIGGDGSCEGRFMADGKAEGAEKNNYQDGNFGAGTGASVGKLGDKSLCMKYP